MQMEIVTLAEHFIGIAVEIAIVIFVLEFPTRNIRPSRLPLQIRKLLLAKRSIDGQEMDVLIFAHEKVLARVVSHVV